MIRLRTIGRRNQRTFRLMVTPKKSAPRGKPIEFLGSWDPRQDKISLKKERILYWISQGAKASSSVHNILVKEKVLQGKKIAVHKKSKKKAEVSDKAENKEAAAS